MSLSAGTYAISSLINSLNSAPMAIMNASQSLSSLSSGQSIFSEGMSLEQLSAMDSQMEMDLFNAGLQYEMQKGFLEAMKKIQRDAAERIGKAFMT